MSLKLIIMDWVTSLFKNKKASRPDDRYVMRLSVCHETYSIEEFDLQFKRNTDRDGLPEGEPTADSLPVPLPVCRVTSC